MDYSSNPKVSTLLWAVWKRTFSRITSQCLSWKYSRTLSKKRYGVQLFQYVFFASCIFCQQFNRSADKSGAFGSKVPLLLLIHACKFQEFTITETEVLESQFLHSWIGIKIWGSAAGIIQIEPTFLSYWNLISYWNLKNPAQTLIDMTFSSTTSGQAQRMNHAFKYRKSKGLICLRI